jgi:amino acid adenylation domain-containing protein/non-ribosomal peptide synthase protein (TIGR01720 family)
MVKDYESNLLSAEPVLRASASSSDHGTLHVIDTYELSPMQAGMLFHGVSGEGRGVDIQQVVVQLDAPLDETHFLRAWRRVTERHPILRSRFCWEEVEAPVQEVVDRVEILVMRFDWHTLPATEREQALRLFLDRDRARGFDLGQAPLMRLSVVRASAAEHCVIWTFHHALLDGRSFPPVLREVFDLYEGYAGGAEVDLRSPRPYRDYIDWLRKVDHDASKPYWRDLLSGFRAPTPLIATREAPAEDITENDRGSHEIRLSAALTTALRERARATSVTLNTVLQGCWALLLHRYSGESDIVFGATRACRRSACGGADDMVGLLINTLPMRVRIDPEAELEPWLRELRAQQVALRDYEHTPLVKVQSWSDVPRGTPLFESIVVFDNQSLDARLRGLGENWSRRRVEYRGQTNFPLTVNAYGDPEMLIQIEYSRRRYNNDVVARMLGHFQNLLTGLADPSRMRLKDLSLLTEAERQRAISNPRLSYPKGACLHERFAQQAARTPEAVALVCDEEELSYAELNCRANRLAHRLRALGVKPDQLVGLRIERTVEMVIGILGILKAGGAYLPLDPAYPKDRVAFMLEDSRVGVVVTQRTLAAELDGIAVGRVLLDEEFTEADTNPEPVTTADNLAYAIYTSGSTGKPKGALIAHYNVTRLFEATQAWYHFGPHDVWTLFHSYAFDFSVWELWGALLHGGRLVVVPYWVSRSPEAFRELVVRQRVSVLNQTPSAFRQLIAADLAQPKAEFALRYVIFGGEALDLQSLRPWFERYGDAHPLLVNMYGITETTVHVTYRPIRQADLESAPGSLIGIPIPDLQVYILDPYGEPAPIGVPGEIYVGGAGVARGYLNRPELSAQRFIADPFNSDGARLYRSGDLARRLENGDIEYLGRIDQQVKIRGFRIELGEIEAGISRHPAVRAVAVMAREDLPGDKRLVAYVVAEQAPAGLADQLRTLIRQSMPEYMLPAHFVLLDALPLTQNGKVDRKALPAPDTGRPARRETLVAPRTATEKTLAGIWGTVLGVEPIGIHDHFFELGGDSILSIQVIARCRKAGLHLTPKDLFKRPTIAQLAETVSIAPVDATTSRPVLAGEVTLTPIQRWFLEQDDVGRDHWNQAFIFELSPDTDIDRLEQAFHCVMRHHDALRLRLRRTQMGWAQEYGNASACPVIARIDLAHVAAEQRSAMIAERAAEIHASLNIAEGPLLQAAHFVLGAGEHDRLLIVIHHIAVDAVSWRVILEDLESAYESLKAHQQPELPPKTTSYQTWATRLSAYAQSPELRRSFSWWLAEGHKPTILLPASQGDCENTEAHARSVKQRLSREETQALLQRVPSVYRTQINDVLLTALCRALQQWTGGEAFRIDMEGHGREDLFDNIDVSRTVGWFTTIFPVRLALEAGLDEGQALQSIKEQLRSIPDRGMSYGVLRYLCNDGETRSALSQTPECAILFNYLGQFDQVVAGSKRFRFACESSGPWRSPRSRRTHALDVMCLVRDGAFEVAWKHHPEIHGTALIERLAADFITALRAIIAHCLSARTGGRTPSDFPLAALGQETVDRLWARYPGLEDVYPLSPMQRLFYAMEGAHAEPGFEQWQFRVDGPIETKLLRRAIEQVMARHPILRTAFVSDEGAEPLQVVMRQVALPWSEEDWRGLAPADQEARLRQFLQTDQRERFDLAQAPLMRVGLRRVEDNVHHLVWSTHHLCVDGWSWPLVFREISLVYGALRQAAQPALDAPLTYREYVGWLRNEAPDSQRFWQEQLAGAKVPTPLNLAASPAVPPSALPRFAEEYARIDRATTSRLQALARSQHVTLSTIVQGAWSLLLSHYSGSADVVFGAAFSGRPAELPGIESLVGPCVNNLPVRVTTTPAERLLSWLSQLQQRQFNLAQHQYAPLEQIHRWTQVPLRHRLFDSLIVFQNYRIDDAARRLGSDACLTPAATPETTNYPLTISVTPGEELGFRFIYQRDRFATEAARTYTVDLTSLLQSIGTQPDVTLAALMLQLPEASSGKAAAVATGNPPEARAPYSAPATETERILASLWQDLFGVEQISLDDNFFELGGHSLLLLEVHSRLRATLRADLPVVRLLQYPTIRSLGRYLSGDSAPALAPSAINERARQQREALLRQRNMMAKR